jgi:HEAT repeat protein
MKKWFCVALLFTVACGVTAEQKAALILHQSLDDASPEIRILAARGLALTGDTTGAVVLKNSVQVDDVDACAAALTALRDVPGITCLPVYAQYTEHDSPLVRTAAYRLIAEIDDDACRAMLVHGTHDDVAKIRRICYQGLEKYEAMQTVSAGLRDIDPLTRITAAQVLGVLGAEGMADFIRNELSTESPDIMQHGLIALATIGDESALPMIQELAGSGTWDVRLAALEALLIMGEPDDMNVFKQAIESDDPFVRARAAHLMSRYLLPEKVHLLEQAARDKYTNVSLAALEALGRYRMKKHKKLFAELMDAGNARVRIAAATAYIQVQ